MEIKVLAPKEQEKNVDFGDCFIINDYGSVTVYDCGSDELADQVLDYLKENNIEKINVVLSHNDNDHFNGIPKLINNGVVNSIITLLLLNYTNEIYDKIESKDGRVTKNSLEEHIKEIFTNIDSLPEKKVIDALDDNFLSNNLKIVGPDADYFIDAVAKQFTPNESNNIDHSTIRNAISVQLEINFEGKKVLLTGDADFAAFDDKVRNYDVIQLPHHGNNDMAKMIFEKNEKRNQVLYVVSDNKGEDIKGGSEKLETKGHRILNTKNGTITIDKNTIGVKPKGTLDSYEICNFKK